MADLWVNSYGWFDEGFSKAACLPLLAWGVFSKLPMGEKDLRVDAVLMSVSSIFSLFKWLNMNENFGGWTLLFISWQSHAQNCLTFLQVLNHGWSLITDTGALCQLYMPLFWKEENDSGCAFSGLFRTLQKRERGLWQCFLHLIFTVDIILY